MKDFRYGKKVPRSLSANRRERGVQGDDPLMTML
ncbi:hypothetical protein BH23BAC3_BH23BAC3_17350 [soil metagenome]